MFIITIDPTPIYEFFSLPADQAIRIFMINFGWLPIAFILLWGFKEIWMVYIRTQYAKTVERVLLAIDIPRGNVQDPKAVENIFTYLGGAHQGFNLIETYWEGKFQLSFSFEIVSLGGYTQFLIYTPVQFRNLVESAIYSQYPDAEITEVNDYTEGIPTVYPDDEYDVHGAEFIYANKWVYPIRTYKDFYEEQSYSPELRFKDPMASLMDLCSSLTEGEQLWYQILVTPTGFDWTKESDKEVKRILKENSNTDIDWVDRLMNGFFELMGYLDELILGGIGIAAKKEEKKEDDALKMMNLKPKEKKQVEGIQHKASKIGFKCKQRVVYVAKKEVMNKPKVFGGFVGYTKQFIDLHLNNLKPDIEKTATSASYFFREMRINARKRRLVSAYKDRDTSVGREGKIFNIEELATLWHFPVETAVKAPLIQKAPGRKAEPPMTLPLAEEAGLHGQGGGSVGQREDDIFADLHPTERKRQSSSLVDQGVLPWEEDESGTAASTSKSTSSKASPPDNLPVE